MKMTERDKEFIREEVDRLVKAIEGLKEEIRDSAPYPRPSRNGDMGPL